MMQKLSSYINIRKDEMHSFRLLFIQSLFVGIALAFYFVVVNSFLIQKTSVYNLPQAYIISGLVGFLLIKLYQRLQRSYGILASYYISIVSFVAVVLASYWLFAKYHDHPVYSVYLAYGAYLFNMPFTIIFALCFYSVCARIYNISQSKRLLALAGIGEVVASILTYLVSPLLIKAFGSLHSILPIAAVAAAAVLVPLKLMQSSYGTKFHVPKANATSTQQKVNLAFFRNNRFYMLIAFSTLFSVMAVYFVDYSYLISVRLMSSESGLAIAQIVAVFFSVVKAGELVFSFLSGSILSARGVKFALIVLPVLLTVAFLLAFVSGMPVISNSFFVIGFIFLAKWCERVIRKTITTPGMKVLYQASEPGERLQMETNIEGALNQVATVVSGLLLLLFSYLFAQGKDPLHFLSIVSFICFALFGAWCLINVRLFGSYKDKIRAFLHSINPVINTQRKSTPVEVADHIGSDGMGFEGFFNQLDKQLQEAIDIANPRSTALLVHYNPQLHKTAMQDEQLMRRKLGSFYYTNDNFFSRLAIIRYVSVSPVKMNLRTFKEVWDVSDPVLKVELVNAYNNNGEVIAPNDYFLVESLITDVAREMVWLQATEVDLASAGNAELISLLNKHHHRLKSIFFGLLKLRYEAVSIDIIHQVIDGSDGNVESQLFAVELLENTLDDGLKELIIPIFEPVEFAAKRAKLHKLFPIPHLKPAERLSDILLKSFGWMDNYLKEVTLKHYHKLATDTSILNAFTSSRHNNLRLLAEALVNPGGAPAALYDNIQDLLIALQKRYGLSSLDTMYLCNYAITVSLEKTARRQNQAASGTQVNLQLDQARLQLDAFSLASTITQKQLLLQ